MPGGCEDQPMVPFLPILVLEASLSLARDVFTWASFWHMVGLLSGLHFSEFIATAISSSCPVKSPELNLYLWRWSCVIHSTLGSQRSQHTDLHVQCLFRNEVLFSVLLMDIGSSSTGKLRWDRLHWGRWMIVIVFSLEKQHSEFSSTGQINPSIWKWNFQRKQSSTWTSHVPKTPVSVSWIVSSTLAQ